MLLKDYAFLTPYYLFLFPALGILLIFIYLKFNNNKKIVFPSFFLLKDIKEKKKNKKRLSFPFRFFLELLACLLFSIFFSNLEKIELQENYLFYIGNSFSTKLKRNSYESVFSRIRGHALQTLKDLPNNAKIKIITSDNKDSNILLDKKTAQEKINSIINSYSNENIKNKILIDNDYKKIYFFTDKNIKSKDNDLNITSFYDPALSCNFAILSLTQILDNLNFEITSFCKTNDNVNIKILCDEKKVYEKNVYLSYLEDFQGTFNIEKLKAPFLSCKITIDSRNDLLQEDNEAYFVLNNNKLKDVFLATTRDINKEDFITLPFEIKKINADMLNSLNKNDIVIFDNIDLKELPKFSSIINLPGKNSIFFKKILENEENLSFFEKGNPLITYTDPLEASFKNAISLNENAISFSNEIFKVNNEIIFSTYENGNKKFIFSGFNILPFKDENLFSKIIFLNSMKYLLKNDFNYLYKNLNENSKIETPGIYIKNDEKQAFNFFSKDESNILGKKTEILSTKKISSKINLKSKNIIKDIIIKFLILLLLLEILYMFFREKR